ncbi:hypothetical protein Bca4012_098353 [Brassica carinata]
MPFQGDILPESERAGVEEGVESERAGVDCEGAGKGGRGGSSTAKEAEGQRVRDF